MRAVDGYGPEPAIRAAGGVLWRPAADGVEVCLVHRPWYDDWSLPKGKLEPDEHPLAAAVREVAEETGLLGVPQVRLPSVRYRSGGVPKRVDYWSMRVVSAGAGTAIGSPAAPAAGDGEVDEVRWLPLPAALASAGYPGDVRVLRAFATLPPVETVLGLIRHGWAGRRGTWSGPDSARPLDGRGWAQAHRIGPPLATIRPDRLLAAPVRRCVQTLGPLAGLLGLPVEVDGRLDEPHPGQDVDECALALAGRLTGLGVSGVRSVCCGQGAVIPRALRLLAAAPSALCPPGDVGTHAPARGDDRSAAPDDDQTPGRDAGYATERGDGWLLAFDGRGFLAATRI